MLIALVANTRTDTTEFHVEYDPPHTLELIEKGTRAAGHDFIFIEASKDVAELLKIHKPDLVFNRAEGIRGESRESHIPAILEMLNIPYVGSNILTTSVSLNKAWTKKIIEYHHIKTPKFFTCSNFEDITEQEVSMKFPYIMKPNDEGSSMGIDIDNVVHDDNEFRKKIDYMFKKYKQEILVEEFIEGREFSVGMLQQEDSWKVFPILEIDFNSLPKEIGSVFGQHAKTLDAELDYCVIPAKIDKTMKLEIEITSRKIVEVLEVRDFARLDFRMDSNSQLFFLEINPLPGMDLDLPRDFSFYPLMALRSGLNYDQLINELIKSACRRYDLEG